MKILFVSSEVVPFAKTGGLADVTGALPKALAELSHDVRIILPRYKAVDITKFKLKKILDKVPVVVGSKKITFGVWEGKLPGTLIPAYFIESPQHFDRDGLYQDKGLDYPDNLERFSLFSQAVLAAMPRIEFKPDVVHCHDWQASLVCAHLALTLKENAFWKNTKTILTVHNLAYQGNFGYEQWPITNLPNSAFSIDGLEFYGKVNCLKGGLVFADVLTTVSPTYSLEIQTPEFGCGLEGVLVARKERLFGVLNGIDPEEWNPETDKFLEKTYSADKVAGKSLCKLALQRSQKLPEHHVLLIGMIQRLAEQKGIDIFTQGLEALMELPIQIVILGTGEPAYHEKLLAFAKRFPQKLSVNIKFDNALAHQIEAGSDAFLMPSRFEPCGLNQMYSMRYGAVPIVRRVGGLADTVTDVSPGAIEAKLSTGFVFDEYSSGALIQAVKRSVAAFSDHTLWKQLVKRGMKQDCSWSRSAKTYESLYEKIAKKAPSKREAASTRS
jgi:starch synthase